MRLKSFDRVLIILAVSVLAASACNGDDDEDDRQEVDNQTVNHLIVENQIVANQNTETRGTFTPEACKDDGQAESRIDVPANAVLALYFDINGAAVGTSAEDLHGTENKRMCPAQIEGGPGGCTPKPPWCKVTVDGVNYCVKATPCPN
jgi:hypothetical protein